MSDRLPNGGAAGVDLVIVARHEVVRQSVRRAHRRAAVAGDVPRGPHPRPRRPPIACRGRSVRRETIITPGY